MIVFRPGFSTGDNENKQCKCIYRNHDRIRIQICDFHKEKQLEEKGKVYGD